jgi:alpha-beta hydrolase superfamily lysophospholipase
VSAYRRWCLLAALATAVFLTAGCGSNDEPRRLGNDVTFMVPAAPGSAEQVRIQGIDRGQGAAGVVLAHMLNSSQSAWAPLAEALVEEGLHVFTFDFRGHGLSDGSRDPARADLDLAGAIAKIRSLGATSVVVVGASVGGTAAIGVAAIEDLAGVVTISAPLQIDSLDASRAVGRLGEPSLFIVAERDDRAYVDAARSLHAAAPEPKKLEIVKGTGAHGTDLVSGGRIGSHVEKLILEFIVSHRG